MNFHFSQRFLAVTALALGVSTAAWGYNFTTPTLSEQTENNYTYVTGGVGDDERTELEAAKAEYSLHVLNSTKSGAYVSDVSLVVQDRKGNDLIATTAGPMFFAKLPAGKYTLIAEYNSVTQTKHVVIGKKPVMTQFLWNAAE